MKKSAALIALLVCTVAAQSCQNMNPFLRESQLPFGAPEFDKIRNEHYIPAFEQACKEAKAEIDAIVANPEAPTFENTILAMEFGGKTLNKVAEVFFNVNEADTDDEKQQIAEKVSPMLTEVSLYSSLNPALFARVKAVYDKKDELGLEKDQMRILEKTYKSFVRSGALLDDEAKKEYSELSEKLSLLSLQFQKNLLASTNAWYLHLTEEAELEGLPRFVKDMGLATASEKNVEGWAFDLSYPSMSSFMKYSTRSDLKRQMYLKYNSRAFGGEFDNSQIVRDIVSTRTRIAQILGYDTWADYNTEDRMVGGVDGVRAFQKALLEPSLPVARKEVRDIFEYAKSKGYEGKELAPWDFSYWSAQYKDARYSLKDEDLKPYFQLENCIDAVLGLATKLYGITFAERKDIPVYHPDVKVFEVKDEDGSFLALFYADFFPRASKRGGAWMTEFRGTQVENGVEQRPFVTIVTNFSKPTAEDPSLITHDELTTFLHEFGHSLHGMLSKGRYPSITGTSVDHDFVELPSQIMENWAFEPEWLKGFARHYKTGEIIPDELIEKIVATKNYLAAYGQVRQLQFGLLDMAWYTQTEMTSLSTEDFEKQALASSQIQPRVDGTCVSTSFNHIFAGGYSAGYYSYKWAEVLEADAFSLFAEKGIFNREVSGSFRENVLSKGSSDEEAVLYRNFRGHDPKPEALLEKLGITDKK